MYTDSCFLQIIHGLELVLVTGTDHNNLLCSVVDLGEVHTLQAFFSGCHTGNNEVHLAGIQGRQQTVKTDVIDLQLHTQIGCDGFGNLDIKAHDGILAVDILVEFVWRIVGAGTHNHGAGLLDFGKLVGRSGRRGCRSGGSGCCSSCRSGSALGFVGFLVFLATGGQHGQQHDRCKESCQFLHSDMHLFCIFIHNATCLV
ncbi:hypothetical protein D3C75_755350 [compost metagenome]